MDSHLGWNILILGLEADLNRVSDCKAAAVQDRVLHGEKALMEVGLYFLQQKSTALQNFTKRSGVEDPGSSG